MSVSRIASRYAKSLIDLAIEQDKLERVKDDVASFDAAIDGSRDFLVFLKSPVIDISKKKSILKLLFDDKYDVLTVKFLELLTQKQREALLPEVADHFMVQYRKLKHISTARITSAVVLTDEILATVKERLEKSGVAYENVELETKVDPKLIGGFILEFGDYVYDTSIAYKLDEVRKEFKGNLYESKILAR